MEEIARFTLKMSPKSQEILGQVAKQFKISQGEVLDVLLQNADLSQFEALFKKARQDKEQERAKAAKERAKMREVLSSLTPEEIALIQQQREQAAAK